MVATSEKLDFGFWIGHIGILDRTFWDFGGFLVIFEEKKLDFWRFLEIFGLFMDILDFLIGHFSFVNKYQ